jgi:hypothetical protein
MGWQFEPYELGLPAHFFPGLRSRCVRSSTDPLPGDCVFLTSLCLSVFGVVLILDSVVRFNLGLDRVCYEREQCKLEWKLCIVNGRVEDFCSW